MEKLQTLVLACLAFVLLAKADTIALAQPAKRALTIEDVLDIQRVDRVAISPDGAWAAAVIQRPARRGEVFGRTAYEIDAGRSDIWLISMRNGERRPLTRGARDAAGYWCPAWSPDSRRLAFLSTAPKGHEPRGGDNVRLYLWDSRTGALGRVDDGAVMTQTRYGGAIDKLDLRGGADRRSIAHACSDEENAPFLWLDETRLLAMMLPTGGVSGLIDQYGRPFRQAARDAARLRDGTLPTVRAVASGAAAAPAKGGSAILAIVDPAKHSAIRVAELPVYPFRANLSVSVAPNGREAALLVTLGALRPQPGQRFPNSFDTGWTVERRLGFVDLVPDATVRWAQENRAARFPLELYDWSPDSRTIAFRARANAFATDTPLFIADGRSDALTAIGAPSVGGIDSSADASHAPEFFWLDSHRMLARQSPGGADRKAAWRLVDAGGGSAALNPSPPPPDQFFRAGDGSLLGIAGSTLYRLDSAKATVVPIAALPGRAEILFAAEGDGSSAQILVTVHRDGGKTTIDTIDTATGSILHSTPKPAGDLLDADPAHGIAIAAHSNQQGLSLSQLNLRDGSVRNLATINSFMARVDWGETRLIDYRDASGEPLNAAVILPPDYQPGHRYPTLVWVYGGYRVRSLKGDYWLDPALPGIYNLQLYAAKGYVVMVPSMPLPGRAERSDVYAQIPLGVMPAIDRLVALGIADPDRLGVFGQSFGGYSVYALLSQTDRFKAAVAIAGITDLTSFYGEFDPTARGYPGIAHEKSDNWAEVDFMGRQGPPWTDPQGYARNSPLSYVDRVHTPLLMIQGDFDIRGAASQAEQFFYSLYAQGKTAELLSYGGESHGLNQSPANVRDIHDRMLAWFDRFVKGQEAVP